MEFTGICVIVNVCDSVILSLYQENCMLVDNTQNYLIHLTGEYEGSTG